MIECNGDPGCELGCAPPYDDVAQTEAIALATRTAGADNPRAALVQLTLAQALTELEAATGLDLR